MIRILSLVSLSLSLACVGCVTRADFERVRRDQQGMRALLADSQVAVDKMNRRLDTMQADGGDGAGSKAELKRLERRVTALEMQSTSWRLAHPTSRCAQLQWCMASRSSTTSRTG